MSFSLNGLIIILLPLLPNIVFLLFPSNGMPKDLRDGGLFVNILEHGGRIGYYLTMVIAYNTLLEPNKSQYLIGMALCLLLYFMLWGRYFAKGQSFDLLFKSVWGIPLPMAVFPILYYILAAVWLNNAPAIVAILLFAIGHFINSYITYSQIRS